MQEILVTQNLCKHYGNTLAVDNVSISVPQGSICGLVGKNGAGKTTLMRMLCGLVAPNQGSICLVPNQARTSTTVGAVVESPSLYQEFCAMDNLVCQCKLLGIPADKTYLEQTLELCGIGNTGSKKVKDFSLGMKQRLAIAMALVGKPQLLILDEPTNGLDPEGIHNMRNLFVDLNQKLGISMLISSHILAELEKFATEFLFMHKGKIVAHVTQQKLAQITKKGLQFVVDNAENALPVVQNLGEFAVDGNKITLFGEVDVTDVVVGLFNAGVRVLSVASVGETLEDFFIRCVGGAL